MSIKTKFVLCLVFGVLFFIPFSVKAGLTINEIMYDLDDADIDWIEIYNSGNEESDISLLKLLISNSTANHSIKAYSGKPILNTGEYGVIVVNSQVSSYIEKWGSEGNLFTASFSLPNVSEEETATIQINQGDKISPIDSVTYEALFGASGDGNSLQIIDGSLKSSTPTPNKENVFDPNSVVGEDDNEEEDNDDDDDEDEEEDDEKTISKPKIKAKIFVKNTVYSEEPIELEGVILENGKKSKYRGRYYWNFGDGSFKEEFGYSKKFRHIFYYPGEYVVSMEYYPDAFSIEPDYIERIVINVIPVNISITKVGGEKDFGIEITNSSQGEIDVSEWYLIGDRKVFFFPKKTIVLPQKSLTVSSRLTGFSSSGKESIKMYSSRGELISQYLIEK
ncbi:MAG: hypothetical protein WCX79_02695 [Candidatus Paceibacterota bacterium]|jgi:hypothetical protein